MNLLRKDNKGYQVGNNKIPIVPGAIIFDLMNGGEKNWDNNPYINLANKAYNNLCSSFKLGSYGAGKGATAGNIKGGLGSASLIINNKYTVVALMIINSFGSVVVNDTPYFWAALLNIKMVWSFGNSNKFEPFNEVERTSPDDFKKNTVIGVVATDAKLSKQMQSIRYCCGITRTFSHHIQPLTGLIFSVSWRKELKRILMIYFISTKSALCVSRSIARGVYHASNSPIDTLLIKINSK